MSFFDELLAKHVGVGRSPSALVQRLAQQLIYASPTTASQAEMPKTNQTKHPSGQKPDAN